MSRSGYDMETIAAALIVKRDCSLITRDCRGNLIVFNPSYIFRSGAVFHIQFDYSPRKPQSPRKKNESLKADSEGDSLPYVKSDFGKR